MVSSFQETRLFVCVLNSYAIRATVSAHLVLDTTNFMFTPSLLWLMVPRILEKKNYILCRASEAPLKAVATHKHRFYNLLSISLFLPRLSSDDWPPWGVKVGCVGCTSFLVGLSRQVYSLVFCFCWRHRLAAVGQPRSPALSWFFAVAEWMFVYVSKSKLNFGFWNLNLVPIICWAYSVSAQWAFDPRCRTDAELSKVECRVENSAGNFVSIFFLFAYFTNHLVLC